VRETDGSEPLLAALDELATLEDGAALDELRARLRERRLRVLVAGEAKRGKSTVVNSLLGQAVRPAGVTPLTAVATTVRYGPAPDVRPVFADGRAERFPLSALEDLVTERRNPGNRRHVGSVTVVVDAPAQVPPAVPSGSVSRSRSRSPSGWCATSTGAVASGSTTSNWLPGSPSTPYGASCTARASPPGARRAFTFLGRWRSRGLT